MVSLLGRNNKEEARPLYDGTDETNRLMFNELGPLIKVGPNSVAVGCGAEVKLISAGVERFGDSPMMDMLSGGSLASRSGTSRRPRRAGRGGSHASITKNL